MKKIINSPEKLVDEMCRGLCLANTELKYDRHYRFLYRDTEADRVVLISGGGSGHEPAHAGYIGRGMLNVAVCGDVFASPSQIQVYHAIRQTQSPQGTLLIIKNYSGDIMNFRNAAEMAKEDGILVDSIKVDDDIAVKDSLYTVGRRGVAGTVLVHKVAGAASEEGHSLEKVKKIAEHAADSVRSIGFAFTSCTVPASGVPTFEINDQDMEYGVGIHGEPGRIREPAEKSDDLAERMSNQIIEDMGIGRGDEVTVLVNGFGGTPLQELYVFNTSVRKALDRAGVRVHRCFVGNYMTSIDMQGASLSLMRMDDELKHFIDAPSYAPAFRVDGAVQEVDLISDVETAEEEIDEAVAVNPEWKRFTEDKVSIDNIREMVRIMMESIIRNEVPFCKLDSYAGDGDFGMSVAKGFRQLRRKWNSIIKETTIGGFLRECSLIIMEYCGGASGPIWGSAFRAAGFYAGSRDSMDLCDFAGMLRAALTGIQTTGERSFGRGAQVGDKTLVDALEPAVEMIENCAERANGIKEALSYGANAAVDGAERTKSIAARMGRAGTVGTRSLGYPDAGAFALGVLFTDIANGME